MMLCPMPPLLTDNETSQHEWISSEIKTEKPITQDFMNVSVELRNDDFSFSFSLSGPRQGFDIYHNPEFIRFEEGNGTRSFYTYLLRNIPHMIIRVRFLMTQSLCHSNNFVLTYISFWLVFTYFIVLMDCYSCRRVIPCFFSRKFPIVFHSLAEFFYPCKASEVHSTNFFTTCHILLKFPVAVFPKTSVHLTIR